MRFCAQIVLQSIIFKYTATELRFQEGHAIINAAPLITSSVNLCCIWRCFLLLRFFLQIEAEAARELPGEKNAEWIFEEVLSAKDDGFACSF